MFLRRAKLGAQAMPTIDNSDVYTELEYLQSSGLQMINTGLRCNADSEIEIDQYSYASTIRSPILSDYADGVSSLVYISRSTSYISSGFGGESFSVPTYYGRELVIMNRSYCYVNAYKYTFTTEIADFTSEDIYLFKNPSIASGTFYMRLFSLKITIDGVLHEIIPVLDEDGVPAMYNKTRREFYYNIGEGEFAYG